MATADLKPAHSIRRLLADLTLSMAAAAQMRFLRAAAAEPPNRVRFVSLPWHYPHALQKRRLD